MYLVLETSALGSLVLSYRIVSSFERSQHCNFFRLRFPWCCRRASNNTETGRAVDPDKRDKAKEELLQNVSNPIEGNLLKSESRTVSGPGPLLGVLPIFQAGAADEFTSEIYNDIGGKSLQFAKAKAFLDRQNLSKLLSVRDVGALLQSQRYLQRNSIVEKKQI